MEWVECMGVASGCGEHEAGVGSGSGWNPWVWLVGVVVRKYIEFLILLIPTPLVYVLFAAASLHFVHLKKCFSFLFQYFLVIKFYGLNTFLIEYKHAHIRANTGVPRQPYEGCICFIHEEAHTNVRFIPCDGHQLYDQGVWCKSRSRGRALYRDASRAAYVLGPPLQGTEISN